MKSSYAPMRKSRLGQNFLFDPGILDRIVEAAEVGPEDTVVEIGPGLGRMTQMLAAKAKRVIAIELDNNLYQRLLHNRPPGSHIEPVLADCLKYPYENLNQFKVVANIPYYITTPIIFKLIESGDRLISMTLTVQKEVAKRITASHGSKEYGVLSIAVQLKMESSIVCIIPRGAFRPPPRVDSAVIHMKHRTVPLAVIDDETHLMKVVRAIFSTRRKTLLNGLKPFGKTDFLRRILDEVDIPAQVRPEELSIETLAALSNAIKGKYEKNDSACR